ncbi:MAG: hypothetical protein JWR52_3501 [Marmoricola sp.]|nr:hypothetical protein [Marmoricola sp.]
MRVAIIGYSGAGKTTVATALAGLVGARPIGVLDEMWKPLAGPEPLVLDGIPTTIEELEQLDAHAREGRPIEHILYLRAPSEIRIQRVARMVIAGANPRAARERMLHPAELAKVTRYLETTGRLAVIDATGSRTEVLAHALDAVGRQDLSPT